MSSKHIFYADNVTLFRFDNRIDREGTLIPPQAVAQFIKKVPVLFDSPDQTPVGWAEIHRFKNTIIGNLELCSDMSDGITALKLIEKLTPCVVMTITAVKGFAVLGFSIDAILLSEDENTDKKIQSLETNGFIRGDKRSIN